MSKQFDSDAARQLFAESVPRADPSLTPRREPPPDQVRSATIICFVHGGLPLVGGFLLYLGLRIDRSSPQLYADPVDGVIFGTMIRWLPLEVFLAAATCALAAFVGAGLADARRPLAAILALRTISPLAFGLSVAANLPIEASLSLPGFWRFMLFMPALVAGLIWGVPAYVAIRLLRHPASRDWLAKSRDG